MNTKFNVVAAGFVCAALLIPSSSRADTVTDWNELLDSVAPRYGAPQQQSRAQAIVQIAVHDALNTIEPRYVTYTDLAGAAPGASPDAAVAAAASEAMLGLLAPVPDSPEKQAAIAAILAAFDATVGPEPYDAATEAGIDAGAAAAAAILALRTDDGSATPHVPYTEPPGPGVYQPTPNPEFPAQITPSFEGWAFVTPFALRHGAQFEVGPGAIFDLTGEEYTEQYNQVKTVGDALVRGNAPDSEESDIARFWPGGGSNWNLTTRVIVEGLGLDLWEHARLFALLNMAMADALIANQTWKYTYKFWRPVTAIRWDQGDGNPNTEYDPNWRPFLVTPPYPDFPCALPTISGAGAEALRQFFGTDEVAFTRTFNAGPVPLPAPLDPLPAKPITRSYDSLSEAEAESQMARVYAGIHFHEGCVAGGRQGNQVGRFTVRHYLKPVKRGKRP
jgi:hypothetical protein